MFIEASVAIVFGAAGVGGAAGTEVGLPSGVAAATGAGATGAAAAAGAGLDNAFIVSGPACPSAYNPFAT